MEEPEIVLNIEHKESNVLIDDLIKALSEFKNKHGNLPVYYFNDYDQDEIESLELYAEKMPDVPGGWSMPRRLLIV
jgi:hypothetical protein